MTVIGIMMVAGGIKGWVDNFVKRPLDRPLVRNHHWQNALVSQLQNGVLTCQQYVLVNLSQE